MKAIGEISKRNIEISDELCSPNATKAQKDNQSLDRAPPN
jgi:hypothetical protein